MGEVKLQSQNQTLSVKPTPSTPQPSLKHANSPPPPSSSSPISNNHIIHQNQEQHFASSMVEPTDLFSMLHLTTPPPCCHRHPPCSAATNPMKRRSPPSSSSGEPCAKKLFCDQEDLSLHGFSAVTVPLNLNPLINKRRSSVPVLRRCVSDPYQSPAPVPAPDNSSSPATGSGLPPLPPKFQRSVSDLSHPPEKALSVEETAAPDSVRLRRMKERLKEMRQWWDEVMKDEEGEEEEDGREEECEVVAEEDDEVFAVVEEDDKVLTVADEDDKVLPQDDLVEEDYEEAVSVEWAERCVSLTFRCPCGKGYEVLLSENNCYYKLV